MNVTQTFGGRRVLAVAVVAGLILRGVILWQTQALGTRIGDEKDYSQLAGNILRGNGLAWDSSHPTSIRPPLYPGMVASVWAFASADNLQAVRLVQIVLALLTTALVYQIGRRAFRPDVGRYAAALFWLSPSLMFFNFMLLTETLFTLLLVAFVLLTVMLVQTPRVWIALACGATLGLSALTRSVLWPLPIILCPLLTLLIPGTFRLRIALPALLALGYLAVIGPWAIRNTRLQGVVTVVDTMGGLNLRMGNYEYTPDDRMWAAVGLHGEKGWSYELAQEYPERTLSEGEKDKWAQSKALEYVRANPGITLRRDLIKFADFWGLDREFIAGVAEGLFAPPRWFAAVASLAIVAVYVVVMLAGTAGMWLCAPDRRIHALLLLPVLVIMGIHTVVFGHSRYHVPLMPIFGLYAAAMLTGETRMTWERSAPRLLAAGAFAMALVAIWIRQVAFVDAERIRLLLSRLG